MNIFNLCRSLPDARIQLCLVHMVRHCLRYVAWKQHKEVAADLKTIYQATTVEEAEFNLGQFEDKWNTGHPTIGKSRWWNWERIIPLCSYTPEIRKAIYTAKAIESVDMSLQK